MKFDVELDDDIKRAIRTHMRIDDDHRLNEAFVAQAKQFDIKTKNLTSKNLDAHRELYHKYVRMFNEASARLDSIDGLDEKYAADYRATKQLETYALNAIQLHELFFANIGDLNSTLYADTYAYMRLERDFGDFKRWQDDFIACALASREGWVVCCLNTFLKRYVNVAIDGHDANVPIGCMPMIVIDMWSHSYYSDFYTDKEQYVRKLMSELDWDVIEQRFVRAERMLEALAQGVSS